MPPEPMVSQRSPMPDGYGFLKKGNPFMTALCRRMTHASKETLYVVYSRRVPVGLRAPKWILDKVIAEEHETRTTRQAAVAKRDEGIEERFQHAIRRLFPQIPPEEMAKVLKRALKKRSGRVGRAGKLDMDDKVRLAVGAHVRHCHTPYDEMMDSIRDRAASRKAVQNEVSRILQSWGGDPVRETKTKSSKGPVARPAARARRGGGNARRAKHVELPTTVTQHTKCQGPKHKPDLEFSQARPPSFACTSQLKNRVSSQHEVIEISDLDEECADDSGSDGSWGPSDDEDGQGGGKPVVITIDDDDC